MNIGKPKRRHTVEPVENPVPREAPASPEAPAPPQKQPVSAPAK